MRSARVLTAVIVLTAFAAVVPSADSAPSRYTTYDVPPSVIDAGERIEFVGLSWSGTTAPASIRFRSSDGTWAAWADVDDNHFGTPDRFVSALIPAGGAHGFEVRLPARASAGKAFVAMGLTGESPAPSCEGIVPREHWSSDESKRTSNRTYWRPQKIVVHHTGETNVVDPGTSGAAWVDAIYRYHVSPKADGSPPWDDIGYHFLISPRGCIFEGRWSGDDGIMGFDGQGKAVEGAHMSGFNRGTIAVALLGNFSVQQPTEAALHAAAQLIGEMASTTGIEPHGSTQYVDPQKDSVTTGKMNVSGHRDWAATECPGQNLYLRLGQIRDGAARFRHEAQPLITANQPVDVRLGEPVEGQVTDSPAGVHSVRVQFDAVTGSSTTVQADLVCWSNRTRCEWSASPPGTGVYRTSISADDRVGNRGVAAPVVVWVSRR